MTALQALVLGIVEGLTEFLPISSTGHMILVSAWLAIEESVTLTTFQIVVQCGAILAVALSYYNTLFKIETIKKLTVAFIPTGIAGVLLFPFIKHLLGSPFLVACMLVLGGVAILLTEKHYSKKNTIYDGMRISDITYTQALFLGLYQAIAIIPGVSRSGAVIVGGLLHSLPRKILVEFTFLLAVPTMLAATLYTLLKKHNELSFESLTPILIGTTVSFFVALFVIRFALMYIKNHSFALFAWYRIILGIILLFVLL